MEKPNFKEYETLEGANQVNLDEYVFLERLSVERKCYCFKIREAYRKKG